MSRWPEPLFTDEDADVLALRVRAQLPPMAVVRSVRFDFGDKLGVAAEMDGRRAAYRIATHDYDAAEIAKQLRAPLTT